VQWLRRGERILAARFTNNPMFKQHVWRDDIPACQPLSERPVVRLVTTTGENMEFGTPGSRLGGGGWNDMGNEIEGTAWTQSAYSTNC
jgi:hypothetical protein